MLVHSLPQKEDHAEREPLILFHRQTICPVCRLTDRLPVTPDKVKDPSGKRQVIRRRFGT